MTLEVDCHEHSNEEEHSSVSFDVVYFDSTQVSEDIAEYIFKVNYSTLTTGGSRLLRNFSTIYRTKRQNS